MTILITLHGMGTHTDESFKKEINDAANRALHRYAGYEDAKFEDSVQIIPITYDDIFQKVRQRIVEANKPIVEFLQQSPDILQGAGSVIAKMSSFEASLGKDTFLSTHAFDVLLYLSNVGEWVRNAVATKIEEIILEYRDTSEINFLAHSLGSAVLHDTLVKLMGQGGRPRSPHLDPNHIRFNSIWMIANVSRLLAPFASNQSVYHDIVQPGDQGCTRYYFNARHVLDPFTRPRMFDPLLSDEWVSSYAYHNRYFNLVTKAISRANVHDVQGYLEDPIVSIPFLQYFVGFKYEANSPEVQEGNKKFIELQGKSALLEAKFKNIDSLSDVGNFLQMAKDLPTLFAGV